MTCFLPDAPSAPRWMKSAILGGRDGSNSRSWWTAATASYQSGRITWARTCRRRPRNGCAYSSWKPTAKTKWWWSDDGHDVEPQGLARHPGIDGRRNQASARHGGGVQGGRRTRGQKSAIASWPDDGESVHRALDAHAHEFRISGEAAVRGCHQYHDHGLKHRQGRDQI